MKCLKDPLAGVPVPLGTIYMPTNSMLYFSEIFNSYNQITVQQMRLIDKIKPNN
jgi:hypothetical protein